jgi:hypothetical protein
MDQAGVDIFLDGTLPLDRVARPPEMKTSLYQVG